MKKILALCSAAVLLCGMVSTPARNISRSVASDDITGIIEQYRQEIPQLMRHEKIPGLAIAVVDDQSILWAEGFGYTDWDNRIPITPATLFSIQSMSKSFTATAVMFAAQDGLLDLDAPITTYLPKFHINSIFEEHPEQKITLRILLSHTAGLAHEASFGGNYDLPAYSFERHIASISDTWLKFPVGTRYSYSNLGIDLAGYILQVRAGVPFIRYVQEKVLDPLGMASSTMDVKAVRATPGRAIGHYALPLSPPVDWLLIPSGGVWTTAEDMARYLQFHINKGALEGTCLLSENLAETMYTPPNVPAHNYALGVIVTTRHGARHIEHGGGGFGFISYMIWYPELKIGAVVLTNAEQSNNLPYDLNEAVLDSIIESVPALYHGRSESVVRVEPAYPPSSKETILYDDELKALIVSKALPEDDAALKRRKAYTGMYVLTKWGIPVQTVQISDKNGDLYYTLPGSSGFLTEVEPGLFFSSAGEAFDVRGPIPRALNIHLVKTNRQALPIKIAFYAVCGLIFLSALFFWPVRGIIRRMRRKSPEAATSVVGSPRSPWLIWTGLLVALASLFSLLCLGIVTFIPDLIYVPWPLPYSDLTWWQFSALSLPFASLLLAIVIAVLAGPVAKIYAWRGAIRLYHLIVALALLVFDLAIIM